LLKHASLSSDIIKCFYEVYNELGRGFLESVYQEAMLIRLQEDCIPAVIYKNNFVLVICYILDNLFVKLIQTFSFV